MHRPRVYVTRQIFPDALDLIEKSAALEVWPDDEPPTPEQLQEALADVDGALINVMDRIDAPLLDAAPKLKVISQVAVGLDNIDIPEATKREILVGYTPGVLAKATADLAFGLLLAAARRVVESDKWVREGNWKISHHPMFWLGSEVNGSTLGIIGLGGIGLETAKRGLGFDMKIIYHSSTWSGSAYSNPYSASSSVNPGDSPLHRREAAQDDENHCDLGEHVPRPGGGHRRPI